MSNILDVNVLADAARRPKKLDLAGYWNASVARVETELHLTRATVLAGEVGLKQLRLTSALLAGALSENRPTISADGRMCFTLLVEVSDHAVRIGCGSRPRWRRSRPSRYVARS